MISNSAYIVQTQVISMGSRPFLNGGELRPSFYPIFNSKNCFTDMRDSIFYFWLSLEDDKLSPKPFIRKLGQICFNTRSTCFIDKFQQENFGIFLRRNESSTPLKLKEELYGAEVFGYDLKLEDQRMNYLYFELLKPLFLKATFHDQTQADGKIFIHLYPSGYIIIHLAIALKQQQILHSLNNLHQAIQETRPMHFDSRWIWSCRLGTGKLNKIVELIKENIYQSLYANLSISKEKSIWHSALKLITTYDAKRVADRFFKGGYDLLNLGPYKRSEHDEYLLSSKQGIICGLSPYCKQRTALLFFWRILAIYEFVMLKSRIYDDYAEFLRSEIANLKDSRFSTLRKFTREDIRRLSVYDPKLPQYLAALDKHIRSLKPFYRRVYSSISKGTGFGKRREKVKKLVEEWESEVGQWDHSLVVLWKKVISPLRSIIKIG